MLSKAYFRNMLVNMLDVLINKGVFYLLQYCRSEITFVRKPI